MPPKKTRGAAKTSKPAKPSKTTDMTTNKTTKATKTGRVTKTTGTGKTSRVAKAAARGATSTKVAAPKPDVNTAPTDRLDIYVFGSNSNAELGLGEGTTSKPVTRPRANPLLSNIVDIAVGAQHCIALTNTGTVLTWGANDLGALGRDTSGWSGGLVDADDSDSDDDAGGELNPKESTPTAVFPLFGGETVTSVAASDNASFVVTNLGHVYGWGTFRDTEGHSHFSEETEIQKTPTLIPQLENVQKLATGNDHVLALTSAGHVFAWGINDAHQLGRKIGVRHKMTCLVPAKLSLRKRIESIAAGSYHSFAIDHEGTVYSCGLNNFGQNGHSSGLGEGGSSTIAPAAVKGLKQFGPISDIAGGEHHSIAATRDGQCLVWGRLDGMQTGLKVSDLSEDQVITNEYGARKILKVAGVIPQLKVASVDASIDCCIAVTTDGKPYSWGFSESYRTGLGTDDDVEMPTHIIGKAVNDKVITWAGLGGQFGVLASVGK